MITVKKFTVNPFQENSYLLSDETGECILIDAGFYFPREKEEILDFIAENKLKPVSLLNTHCHFDHVMGADFIRQKFGIPFRCHAEDAFWLGNVSEQGFSFGIEIQNIAPADGYISENDIVRFGNSTLRTIHVPGHSPGHVVFYSAEDRFLIAGDVLFYESIGRSDLPGGNYIQLIQNIKEKLLVLPSETAVYSGHGNDTSIGFEKNNNPYLI